MATMILARGTMPKSSDPNSTVPEAIYVWKNNQLYRLEGKKEIHVRECPTREILMGNLEEFLRYSSMSIVEEVEV